MTYVSEAYSGYSIENRLKGARVEDPLQGYYLYPGERYDAPGWWSWWQ